VFDFQARYDGIPHTFSTTARSLEQATTPTQFVLPSPRPDSVAWRAAPYLSPVRTRWNAAKFSLAITPTTSLDFKAEYTRIGKSGHRPLSLSYAGSGGPTVEYTDPIDQTVNDFRFSQSYSGKTFQITGSYAYSMFQNQNKFVQIASPLNDTDTPTNGAAFARVSTPPDNSAKTAAISGAVNFPSHTRVMGSASFSWFRQNDILLPQTSNSILAGSPLLVLPRDRLDGQAKTYNVNLSATTRPTKNLRLVARLRSFDYSNQTPEFHIPAMALADRSIAVADSQTSAHLPFTKSNAEFNANYLFARAFSVTAGYAYETWKRDAEERNIAKTTEGTPKVSVDFTGLEWVTLRGSYAKGTRRGNNYQDSTDAFDFPGFRRFDEGNRNRDRTALVALFTPNDRVNFSLSWQDWNDKFPVAFGAQSDKSNMVGVDADWSPGNRFSVGAGYSIENIDYILKSRYKTGNRGTPTFDNPTWIWFSVDKGKSTVAYATFTAALIPNKLDAGGTFSSAYSRFEDRNYNPTTPSGGTVAQNYNATAYDFPEVWSKKWPLALFLSYRYTADWGMTLRYQMETYRQNDFRTLNPDCYNKVTPAVPVAVDPNCTNSTNNIPPGTDLSTAIGAFRFLGNNFRNYDAGWFTFTLSYRPSALPGSKRRSAL
jgi:MtrB/PioB family decaheme-associated outer membrane protein